MARIVYRAFAFVAAMSLLCNGAATATWTGSYEDLTSRAEYVPSTDIALESDTYYDGLGGSPAGPEGGIGYRLSDFQLNLLYQAVNSHTKTDTRADIEAFDDWRYPSIGDWNFPDGENYFLRIDAGGGLPIGNWGSLDGTQEYQADSGESWVQWTISGWWDNSAHTQAEFHTILAGDIVGGDYLRVQGGYRAFASDIVNPVEVFEGKQLLTEVMGYTLDVPGLNLVVHLVPEPASCVLLAGAAVGALLLRRRR